MIEFRQPDMTLEEASEILAEDGDIVTAYGNGLRDGINLAYFIVDMGADKRTEVFGTPFIEEIFNMDKDDIVKKFFGQYGKVVEIKGEVDC